MNEKKPRRVKDCGIVVKQWVPADGCPNCKQAQRIFHEHTRISMTSNARAIKKIRELMAEIAELKKQLAQKKEEPDDLEDSHWY